MKFTVAWAKMAVQNVQLKTCLIVLGIVVLAQLVMIGALAARNPLVVERACYSRAMQTKSTDASKDEITAFLKEALAMRFDNTTLVKDGFLSLEESAASEKEAALMKQRQMTQKVIVGDPTFRDKDIFVTVDRVVAIGKIKSVLPVNLKILIEQTNRTDSNPYGLVLTQALPIEEKADK